MAPLVGYEMLLDCSDLCQGSSMLSWHLNNWYFNTSQGRFMTVSALSFSLCSPWLIYKLFSYWHGSFCLVTAASHCWRDQVATNSRKHEQIPIFSSTSAEKMCLPVCGMSALMTHAFPFTMSILVFSEKVLPWRVQLHAPVFNIKLCPVLLPVLFVYSLGCIKLYCTDMLSKWCSVPRGMLLTNIRAGVGPSEG